MSWMKGQATPMLWSGREKRTMMAPDVPLMVRQCSAPISIDQAIVERCILVIDPEWRYVDLIQNALTGARCTTTIIASVEIIHEVVQQTSQDAVILTLPPNTGRGSEDCCLLRAAVVGLPLLVLDGRPDIDNIGALFDAGADAYLATNGPYSAQELRARLAALLRRLGKQRQNKLHQSSWPRTAHAG